MQISLTSGRNALVVQARQGIASSRMHIGDQIEAAHTAGSQAILVNQRTQSLIDGYRFSDFARVGLPLSLLLLVLATVGAPLVWPF